MGKSKYSKGDLHVNSWNFMKGYRKALHASNKAGEAGVAAEINISGRVPFVVLVPEFSEDNKKEPFLIVIQDSEIIGEVRFEKIVSNSSQAPIQIAVEDMNGEFTYSIFHIRIISQNAMTKPLSKKIVDDGEYSSRNICELATILISRFIRRYQIAWELSTSNKEIEIAFEMNEKDRAKYKGLTHRRINNKDWIPELNVKRLSPWTDLQVFDEFGEKLYESRYTDFRGNGIGIGTNLSAAGLTILQDLCLKDLIPNHSEYIRLASRHQVRGEYEAFCILIVSALEKLIFELLRDKLKKQKLSDHEIELRLTTGKMRKDGVSAQTISVGKALRILLNGKEYENSAEYMSLEKDIYALRDEIVHGKPIILNAEHANKIGKSFNNFTNYLYAQI